MEGGSDEAGFIASLQADELGQSRGVTALWLDDPFPDYEPVFAEN